MNDKLCDCPIQSPRCSKTCGLCTAEDDSTSTALTPPSTPGWTPPQDPKGRDTTATPGPRPVPNPELNPISPDGAKLLLRGKRGSGRESKMMFGWKDGGSTTRSVE